MKHIRLSNPVILLAGVIIGLVISQLFATPSMADHNNQKVYEYDEESSAYIHCGSYFAYGIKPKMSYEQKKRIAEEKNGNRN